MDNLTRVPHFPGNGPLVSNFTNCTSLVDDISENNNTAFNEVAITTSATPTLKAIIGLIYVLGILIGTTGNFLVVLIVFKRKIPITSTNLFISSLATADLLVTALCMPCFFIYYIVTWPQFPFGTIGCKMLAYTMHTSGLTSSLSLLAIAYDRYFVMSLPFKKISTPQNSRILIIIIWIVSPLAIIPSAISHNLTSTRVNGETAVQCEEIWSTKDSENAYLLFRICVYWLLVIQIALLYFLAGRKILRVRAPQHSRMPSSRLLKEKRKIMKIMFLVVLIFLICWLPYMLVKIMYILPPKGFEVPLMFVFVANILAMINSAVNPIIYASMNGHFLRAFQSLLQSSNKQTNVQAVRRKIDRNGVGNINELGAENTANNRRANVGFRSNTPSNSIHPHIMAIREDHMMNNNGFCNDEEEYSVFRYPMTCLIHKNDSSVWRNDIRGRLDCCICDKCIRHATSQNDEGQRNELQNRNFCDESFRTPSMCSGKKVSNQGVQHNCQCSSGFCSHNNSKIECKDTSRIEGSSNHGCNDVMNDEIVISKKKIRPFSNSAGRDKSIGFHSKSFNSAVVQENSSVSGDRHCKNHRRSVDQSLSEINKGITPVELNLEIIGSPSRH